MHYRLYLIGRDGHFAKAIDLDCENDEHAWRMIKQHSLTTPVELWSGIRRVGGGGAALIGGNGQRRTLTDTAQRAAHSVARWS